MGWFILAQLFSMLVQLIHLGRMSDQEKVACLISWIL
jgi:hypothetical protein